MTSRNVVRPWTLSVLVLLGIVGIVLTGIDGVAQEREFEFTSFDVPGTTYTEPMGINAAGDIVGVYRNVERGVFSGFLLRNGQFSSIDFPSAPGGPAVIRTDARAINPAGDIVGMYRLAGEGMTAMHGYLLTRDGEFRTIDVPGRMGTIAQGILPDGTIVGCSHDMNMTGSMFAFVRDPDGVISELPIAGTMNYGATPGRGTIVGRWVDPAAPSQHYGYVLDGTGWNLFRVPGSTFTQGWGVNPRGEVVGYYVKDGTTRGFVKDGDEFTTLAYPGAVATAALGINASGVVVGTYFDGRWHGFVATRTRSCCGS